MNRITTTAIVLATLGFSAGALAQSSEGKIELTSVAEVEVEIEKENGEIELRRVPAKKILPGNEVIYTITATNVSGVPVGDVVITDPVPEHMKYREGTAIGRGTEIAFSVDQGSSYDVASRLKVVDADGTVRPATPEDYTHIRWKFTQELTPGTSQWVRFGATLQ